MTIMQAQRVNKRNEALREGHLVLSYKPGAAGCMMQSSEKELQWQA